MSATFDRASEQAAHDQSTEQASQPAADTAVHEAKPEAGLLSLQQTAGNAAINGLLVGAADDRAEIDADQRAHRAIAALFSSGAGGGASGGLTEAAHGAGAAAHRSAAPTSGAIGLAGGTLDSDSSQEIAERAGKGRPLDAAVGQAFGSALSANVSRARVHDDATADRLARRMSATAFTVGDDMFFSKGTYRPDNPDGARLLAHELAHVAQNDGTGAHRSVVHRAVGFEFETNIPVGKSDSIFMGLGTKHVPLKKMEVIHDFSATHGVSMEADENSMLGSTIEFVMRPAVEENNRAAMITALDKIVALATELQSAPAPTDGSTEFKPRTPVHAHAATVTRQDVEFFPRAQVTANPQATIGVSVTKVGDMLAEAGTNQAGDGSQALANTHNTKWITEARKHADLTGKPGLQGLVALLAAYLVRGSVRSGNVPLNYAKLISSSVMVRTDFASYFAKLPDPEKTWATGGTGAVGDRLVKTVLEVLGWPAGDAAGKVFERGVRKSNKSDKTGKKSNAKLSMAELDVSRNDWLLGIATGHDALSAHFAGAKAKKEFEGLGRLGPAFDKVGGETTKAAATGAIMELREMKQNVPIAEWKKMGLDVFDYVVAKNAPPPVVVAHDHEDDDESEDALI